MFLNDLVLREATPIDILELHSLMHQLVEACKVCINNNKVLIPQTFGLVMGLQWTNKMVLTD